MQKLYAYREKLKKKKIPQFAEGLAKKKQTILISGRKRNGGVHERSRKSGHEFLER